MEALCAADRDIAARSPAATLGTQHDRTFQRWAWAHARLRGNVTDLAAGARELPVKQARSVKFSMR
jgi:hypothetical protein